jgi:hypothetical protein
MTYVGKCSIWNKRIAILVTLILLLSSFSSIVAPQKTAAATPDGWDWTIVGNSDFSGGGVGKTSFDMYDGIPYIAYYDFKSTSGITVMKYDGNNWVMVGSPRFSGPAAYGFSLFIDKSDGTPYVSYQDGSAGVDNKATVMKFNGTNWEPVGSVGFSPGVAGLISLFVDHGTPYVAFEDSSTGPGKVITVMKYDSSTDWSLVGTPRFASGASSNIQNISVSVYNNTPYISYWKDNYEVKVMTYDSTGGWGPAGDAVSSDYAGRPSLYLDNGTLYVAYWDDPDYQNRVTVKKLNLSETNPSWSMVGSRGFSAGAVDDLSLYVDGGIPYVVYQDCSVIDDFKATVMKYEHTDDPDDTDWENVGSTHFSPSWAAFMSLRISGGIPYVGFQDVRNHQFSSQTDNYAVVMTMTDVGPPTAVDKTITTSGLSETGVTLHWDKASDNVTAQNQLMYQAYRSDSDNIETVTDIEANGTPVGSYTADIASLGVTGLSPDTTYYFNVIVKDDLGNLGAYSMAQVVTDPTPPNVSDGTITASGLTETGVTLEWTKAEDNLTAQIALQYQVYGSESNNIDTVTNIEANGIPLGSLLPDAQSVDIPGLSAGTAYYFNVIVADEAGNRTAYTMKSVTTLDTTVPTVSDGTLSSAAVTDTAVTLGWSEATDNATVQSALQYRVYRSGSNNVDTVTNIEANGTPVGSYTADIGSLGVTGLSPDTTYYFNVIVKDAAGNKNAYSMQQVTTEPDITAPTIAAKTPATNSSGVALNANLILTFNEPVNAVGGRSAVIKKVSDDSIVETIDLTDLSKVSVSGLTYTLNPTANLAYSTQYYVTVDAGAFEDNADNVFAGIPDKTTWTFTTEAAPSSPPPSGSTSGSTDTPTQPPAGQPTDILIVVDGQQQKIATASVKTESGQTVMTVTMDTSKLTEQLANLGDNPTIVIPLTQSTDKVSAALTGDAVKALEGKQAVLEIQTPNGNYKLPGAEISIDALSAQFGGQVNPADITVHVEIAKSDADKVTLMQNSAVKGGYTLVVPPVDFSVTASYNGQTINIDKFSQYVEREIPLPDGVVPSQITTAVVLEADGSIRQVPTTFKERNGKFYAVVNSLTNSTYSLISHKVAFEDVEGHWAKNAVNNMASRMVVSGVDGVHYKPNQAITRVEFAAIVVRAIGLSANGTTDAFSDVKPGDWYVGAVAKAKEYGLVSGYDDGTFRPANPITRQEAMVMIARAMKIVGLETDRSGTDIETVLEAFSDSAAIDNWAKPAFTAAVKSGLVQGSGKGLLPKSNITRAETAAIVERLLQKVGLID